jgi:osmoprotectant transport system ATP-binding protein
VTGSRGEYIGVVDIDTVMNTIKALREDHARDEAEAGA